MIRTINGKIYLVAAGQEIAISEEDIKTIAKMTDPESDKIPVLLSVLIGNVLNEIGKDDFEFAYNAIEMFGSGFMEQRPSDEDYDKEFEENYSRRDLSIEKNNVLKEAIYYQKYVLPLSQKAIDSYKKMTKEKEDVNT